MPTGHTQTYKEQGGKNMLVFITDHYIKNLKRLIGNKHHFVAFLVISSGIEFLGKAISDHDWFKKGMSKKDFNRALAKFPSLNKYANLGLQYDQSKNDESFYAIVRCGIVHASIPLNGITLSETFNNLPTEIGLKDLSADFRKACEDLLRGKIKLGKGKSLNDIICYY